MFVGGDPIHKRAYSVPSMMNNIARQFINHEECFERLVCEIGDRYLETGFKKRKHSSNNNGNSLNTGGDTIDYRSIIGRYGYIILKMNFTFSMNSYFIE